MLTCSFALLIYFCSYLSPVVERDLARMHVKRSCLFGPSVTLVCLFSGDFWVVSDYTHTPLDYLHWIANSLAPALDNIPPTISVAVQLNVTGVAAAVQGIDESLKDSCSEVTPSSDSQLYSTILQSPFVQVNQGRPNLKQLISNEIGDATGRVSINGLYFQVYCSPSLKKILFVSLRATFAG